MSTLDEFRQLARLIARVGVDEDQLAIEFLNGEIETHQFKDLKRVSIITTDEGPMLDDVFWLLLFKTIVMIPQGVAGEAALLPRLQQLAGFDNEAVIKAMASVDNDAFEIWPPSEAGS